MQYQRSGSKIIVRCDTGEEILECLRQVCRQEKVTVASLTGIGAVSKVVVGFFAPEQKKYQPKEIAEYMEITSLVGNVTSFENDVYLHVHGTFSNQDCQVMGGHLNEAWVSCTAEVIVDVAEGVVGRQFSETVGLNLMVL